MGFVSWSRIFHFSVWEVAAVACGIPRSWRRSASCLLCSSSTTSDDDGNDFTLSCCCTCGEKGKTVPPPPLCSRHAVVLDEVDACWETVGTNLPWKEWWWCGSTSGAGWKPSIKPPPTRIVVRGTETQQFITSNAIFIVEEIVFVFFSYLHFMMMIVRCTKAD